MQSGWLQQFIILQMAYLLLLLGYCKGPRIQSFVNKCALGLCALMSIVGLVALTRFIA